MEGRPNEGTGDGPRAGWSAEGLERLVRVQETVLDFRSRELDRSDDLAAAVRRFLDEPVQASLRRIVDSRSTIHTSAVDGDGRACSISASTGYGSGVIAPGTGIFLNNCLGEHELCPDGPGSHPVGARLPSNMAPTVARSRGGDVLAVGSPGSDRITTALLQTLLNHLKLGMSLEDAVAHPRLHVETGGDRPRVAHEPGLALEGLGMETRSFDGPSMFFGGVAACRWSRDGGFSVASDPRRAGGAAVHRAGEAAPAEAPSGD